MSLPVLSLNKDQERRLLSGHLWIYSNEVNHEQTPLASFMPGELVVVTSFRAKPLGIAYVNPHTLLCARLLTRDVKEEINQEFFLRRLQSALQRREQIFPQPYYRWCFAESDFLPGLIIDRFGDAVVGQINTAGMQRLQKNITEAIIKLISPRHFVWRNDTAYRQVEQLAQEVEIVIDGPDHSCLIKENDCDFFASLSSGQKTGWFYDHRYNRYRTTHYVKNKKVLDVFAYLGGFAVPIARAGAKQVMCVDSSAAALAGLQQNAKLNGVEALISSQAGDAFTLLTQMQAQQEKFDVIVLDPPAFIKRKKEHAVGMRAYEQINRLALSLLNPRGILLTASCSMHLSAKDLLNCLRRASIAQGKEVWVIEQLHQDRDHPVHPAIEETNYLKGFIVMVG